jgi:hypothetical protein
MPVASTLGHTYTSRFYHEAHEEHEGTNERTYQGISAVLY